MDDEHIEICECATISSKKEENSVKSKAIVKLLNVHSVAPFARLKCNTDLNVPPDNWNSANSYGLGHSLCHSTGYSSFRMANMFPDCVGEVDVVCDAENIKRLLKLPYNSKGVISMIVHRIGNTLLIDEFDVHKYLFRQAENDWQWLKSFIYENILNSLSEAERKLLSTTTRESWQQNHLISKFLHYSLMQASEDQAHQVMELENQSSKPLPLTGPILPEPSEEEHNPDPQGSKHIFNRNVLWTFEDIRMLIGTDMPIFGGLNRPCISLRLRDQTKPINVLTGIDYWLDNLMCNVPEVVMCYHLDGIVQRYEMIKTEDLPYLEDSKFSPKVIRNVAQNILAFLKANATKSGHTYWLFKAKHDDVVKLYDLTTLCDKNKECQTNPEDEEESNQDNKNPFTIPVAMLLYTVARNMKNCEKNITASKAGAIKTLLDNCIKLLPKEKYPQIVTSSHYILSDLHIPAELNPIEPKFANEEDGNETDDTSSSCPSPTNQEEEESGPYPNNVEVAIKRIQETFNDYNNEEGWKHDKRPPPLTGDTEERCEIALKHISDGLQCLKYFDTAEELKTKEKAKKEKEAEKLKIFHEETHQNMARSYQAIPLPYEPLNQGSQREHEIESNIPTTSVKFRRKSNKKTRKKTANEEQLIDKRELLLKGQIGVIKSWNVHLKILLFEKACLTYATIAEYCYSNENYGSSLKYIYAAIRCQQVVTKHISDVSSQVSLLLGRAGDCFFQISKKLTTIDNFLDEFHIESEVDRVIMEEVLKDIGDTEDLDLPEPKNDHEDLMITSCRCYETAIDCAKNNSKSEFYRRLGSVRNELGVKYMHWSQEEYQKCEDLEPVNGDKEPLYQVLAKNSYECLQKGIVLFEKVNDVANLAFLLCNMGRFMRFRAHIHVQGETKNSIKVQKRFYNEAFTHYQRALAVLGSKKENPELWSLVNWELSTATFNWVKQLQDFNEINDNNQTTEEVEQEVVDLLQKALKMCDIENSGSRQVLYMFRAALIHHRIASFYHYSFRQAVDENRRKTLLQILKIHYEKSTKLFENLNEPHEFLKIQMERIALQEFQCELSQNNSAKIRHMHQGLELFKQSSAMLKQLADQNLKDNDEIRKLLDLFEKRLQINLRTLAKLCTISKNSDAEKYKVMFGQSLKRPKDGNLGVSQYALHLNSLLKTICDL